MGVFMTASKFSVIIVAYRAQDVILDCINSLLRQTYNKEEYEIIIVIDDKETLNVVKDYSFPDKPRIKIEYRNKRGNIPSARNVGINLSDGEIIAFTDSDCIVPECWLENISDDFKSVPSISGVGGAIKPFSLDSISRALALLNMVSCSGGSRSFKRHLATSNAAYCKDLLIKAGGFDENASVGEDMDLYYRATHQGYQILYDPEIVVYHKHRMKLRDIFLWCYSVKKRSIYMLKKYRHYRSLVRQITPAFIFLALFPSVILLGLTRTLVLTLILLVFTYSVVFLCFRKKEYFSGRAGAVLPIVVLTISFGFLLGLVEGYLKYRPNIKRT